MKKILSSLLIFTLIPRIVLASTASNDLKALVDEYTYSMTVEWDQSDKAFAAEKETQLKVEVEKLIQSGLTKEDLVSTYPETAQLEAELKAIDINNHVAVTKFMQEHQSYKKGAAWNSDYNAAIFGFAFIILMVAFISYKAKGCDDSYEAQTPCNGEY